MSVRLSTGLVPLRGCSSSCSGFAVFFIWRSLNKQMKKVDASLPGGPEDTEQTDIEEAGTESIGTEPLNDDRVPNPAKTRGEDDSTEHE